MDIEMKKLKALTMAFSAMSKSFVELGKQAYALNKSMDAFYKAIRPHWKIRLKQRLRWFR